MLRAGPRKAPEDGSDHDGMKLVVLGSRARSSINWRGALIEDALGAASPASGGALGRDIEGGLATASAHGLREADAGTVRAAAPV